MLVGYIRVSSEEQAEHGVSLDAQREKITAYAAINDLQLHGIEADEGISGKDMHNRPGLQKCFDLIGSGDATGIIVTKLDRFSRSTRDVLAAVERFDENNWVIHSIAERLDTSSAIGRFVVTIFAALAQMEREQIAERTKAALDHKRSRGEKIGGLLPYGYRLKRGRLVIDADEQKVISEIQFRADSGESRSAIARDLNRRGVRTRAGKDWTHVQIGRIANANQGEEND